MISFWNCVLGFLLFVSGTIFFVRSLKNRDKNFKDVFGNYISIYAGEIGLIIIGVYLFFKEVSKLW